MRTGRGSSRQLGGAQCMLGYTPLGVGLETRGVGLETLLARPLNFPPRCGSEATPPPRPLNLPPGCGPGDLQGMLGYHTPCGQTDTCKNITFATFVVK